MLREYYNKLQILNDTEIRNLLDIGMTMLNAYPEQPSDNLMADLESYQNAIIGVGGKLEKEYALYESICIRKLEEICEHLYEYSNGKGKDKLRVVVDLLKELNVLLRDTIPQGDYHTSIVLIAKNEDRYIEEWLEFHRLVGIDHFYIYDNDSEPSFKKILEPYIKNGLITYIYYPGKLMQMNAYNHALKYYKYETKYMAFIDADEFLVPVQFESIPEEIDYIMNHYSNRKFKVDWNPGGIAVNWRWYGSSFHKEKQSGLLIEDYLYRADDDYDQNAHIKTICNPRIAVSFSGQPHSCDYPSGYFNISEMGSYVPGAFFYDSSCKHLRINHYHMKSEEDFIEKWHRGWPDRVRTFENDEQLKRDFRMEESECNKIRDEIMLKYADRIKNALSKTDENTILQI